MSHKQHRTNLCKLSNFLVDLICHVSCYVHVYCYIALAAERRRFDPPEESQLTATSSTLSVSACDEEKTLARSTILSFQQEDLGKLERCS